MSKTLIATKQLKMIQAWIEIHQEELLVDWELAVNGEKPFRIAPLQWDDLCWSIYDQSVPLVVA